MSVIVAGQYYEMTFVSALQKMSATPARFCRKWSKNLYVSENRDFCLFKERGDALVYSIVSPTGYRLRALSKELLISVLRVYK